MKYRVVEGTMPVNFATRYYDGNLYSNTWVGQNYQLENDNKYHVSDIRGKGESRCDSVIPTGICGIVSAIFDFHHAKMADVLFVN